MSNQKNNLGMFSQRVEEAINSRFILADRHISGLLKCVATIPELTAVVGETLKNVSYADEYDKARVVLTKNGKSVCKFVMPNDKKRIIAFTVCLLTEFDSGRRSLLEFLTEFFYDEDTNVAYTKFCDTVLKPFKRAGEMVLKNLGSSAASNEDYDEESALKIAPSKIIIVLPFALSTLRSPSMTAASGDGDVGSLSPSNSSANPGASMNFEPSSVNISAINRMSTSAAEHSVMRSRRTFDDMSTGVIFPLCLSGRGFRARAFRAG